jgi:restriction endonuclease S subunit
MSENCIRLINLPFYLHDNGISILFNNNNNYFNHLILSDIYKKNIYNNCTNGSIQKALNIDLLKNINIPIPKNKQLIDNLEPSFSKIEKLQEKINKNDNLYKKYVKELSDEAIIGYE